MSNRMHSIWASFVPNLEICSIDEAFLDFTGMEGFDFERSWGARSSAPARIGIPICLGIAPTKVLAKAANKLAKTDDARQGSILSTRKKSAWRHWKNYRWAMCGASVGGMRSA